MRVVLHIEFELKSAFGVDLFNSDLSRILNCLSVNSCRACQGAGAADLDLGACIRALGSLGCRAAVSGSAAGSGTGAAACCKSCCHTN